MWVLTKKNQRKNEKKFQPIDLWRAWWYIDKIDPGRYSEWISCIVCCWASSGFVVFDAHGNYLKFSFRGEVGLFRKTTITSKLLRISTEHIEPNDSPESELQIDSSCSIGIFIVLDDIAKLLNWFYYWSSCIFRPK